ncbi:MAG TPA: sodium/glutamate symporter [Spirochaetota bacterium]|nr:sodium/glutamate symporter [Spirochaetota bacterium]
MNAEQLNDLMIAVSLLAALLLAGTFLRAKLRILQKILLPSSLIAGFIGLALSPQALGVLSPEVIGVWAALPGRLISVVFACMFLGHAIPSLRTVWRDAGPQICYGFVAGFGQYFVAMLVTMTLLVPLFGVPPIFASILEIGFSGGHGTASGMCEVFGSLGFPDGCDLGLMSATVGITSSVIFGMLLVNLAARRGYTLLIKSPGSIQPDVLSGILDEKNRRSIGTSTVSMNAIEPLAFHLGFVGISILLGWLAYLGVRAIHPILKSFPLFPLAMLGGIVVQAGSSALKADRLLDRQSFERIQGLSLDLLVASAIASLNMRVVMEYGAPFAILMIAGLAWMLMLTWVLAPRMLPDAWFERGVVEFGMQTGVTAVGLLLLRIVDPEYRTEAAPSFGFKQIVYEPLLGGGLLTSISPVLMVGMGLPGALLLVSGIMALFLLVALLAGFFHRHPGPRRSIHR